MANKEAGDGVSGCTLGVEFEDLPSMMVKGHELIAESRVGAA